MNLPIIALIGRSNVGKSSLFNRIAKKRIAIAHPESGVTRDRQFAEINIDEHSILLVDTPGLSSAENIELTQLMQDQANAAIQESDLIILVVDATQGIMPEDVSVAKMLRSQNIPVLLVVNKIDLTTPESCAEFYSLGFESFTLVSTKTKHGLTILKNQIIDNISEIEPDIPSLTPETKDVIRFAIVGKPNVGKSTLVNTMTRVNRVIVSKKPGTTRDSILIPFQHKNRAYEIIDTAGVRRRKKINTQLEKYSVISTLKSIQLSKIVVFLIDANSEITDQDTRLIQYILQQNKGLIIAINKWDTIDKKQKDILANYKNKIDYLSTINIYRISAKNRIGINSIFNALKITYTSLNLELNSSYLTRILENAINNHQPPSVGFRRIKLRFAHPINKQDLMIKIQGKQVDKLPNSYKTYLQKYFEKSLKIVGATIKIIYKSDDNPYS